jgi:sugar phosphate permease
MKKQDVYPWLMVFIGLIAITLMNGLCGSIGSIFDPFLKAEFKIDNNNLSLLKGRDAVGDIATAVLVLLSGILIDRYGSKKTMLFGALVLALAYFLYSKTNSMYQIYGVHILLSMALVTAGTLSNIVLISNWFTKRRGLALGIILIGTSLGGILVSKLPLVAYIQANGWRDAMVHLAILPLILFILVLLFVRKTPAEIGLKAYGEEGVSDGTPIEKTGMSYQDALKTPMFWLIGVCAFLSFYSIIGISKNIILYLTEAGMNIKDAVSIFGVFFIFALIGKFIFSFLTDYINPFKIFTLCSTIMLIGSLGFSAMPISTLSYMLPILALGWGGIYTLLNIMMIKSFGLKALGKINGTISIMDSAGLALGPLVTAMIHDKYNYQTGFMVISVCLLVSTVFSIGFRRFQINSVE